MDATYDHAVFAYGNAVADLSGLDDRARADRDVVANLDRIVIEDSTRATRLVNVFCYETQASEESHPRYVLPGGRMTLLGPSVQYRPRLITTPPALLALPPPAAEDEEGSRRRSPRRTAPGRIRDLPASTIDCGPWMVAMFRW